jgi:hypothetical protein
MIEPALYDIVELRVDLPQAKLNAGQRGTIVEQHQKNIYEVEFSGAGGKTLACLAISSDQFIVVWKSSTV